MTSSHLWLKELKHRSIYYFPIYTELRRFMVTCVYNADRPGRRLSPNNYGDCYEYHAVAHLVFSLSSRGGWAGTCWRGTKVNYKKTQKRGRHGPSITPTPIRSAAAKSFSFFSKERKKHSKIPASKFLHRRHRKLNTLVTLVTDEYLIILQKRISKFKLLCSNQLESSAMLP